MRKEGLYQKVSQHRPSLIRIKSTLPIDIVYTGMTGTSYQLTEKISEISDELKRISLWKATTPDWVSNYHNAIETEVDFCEWLQFIYLPNLLKQTKIQNGVYAEHYVAPQAIKFFGANAQRGKLLQLLVELDSLI